MLGCTIEADTVMSGWPQSIVSNQNFNITINIQLAIVQRTERVPPKN